MKYLLINLIVGLFFLAGALISLKNIKNKNLINFSIGMAISVLLSLLVVDIIPETYELFATDKILCILSGTIIGICILYLLEKKVPHHDHFKEQKHHNNHLNHIGIMTSLALIIHNIVEGMSIYGVVQNDLKSGLIYAIGVGLHNIPFGIEITAMFDKKTSKKMWICLILLTISTFIGGLIIFIFNASLNDFVLGTLLSITIGMIIYLIFNELLIELKENFNKYSLYGILTGIILMLTGVII